MKKYEYVNVSYEANEKLVAFTREHREVIDRYAARGWRFAGMIPTEMKVNGCIRKMDLVFEKDEN